MHRASPWVATRLRFPPFASEFITLRLGMRTWHGRRQRLGPCHGPALLHVRPLHRHGCSRKSGAGLLASVCGAAQKRGLWGAFRRPPKFFSQQKWFSRACVSLPIIGDIPYTVRESFSYLCAVTVGTDVYSCEVRIHLLTPLGVGNNIHSYIRTKSIFICICACTRGSHIGKVRKPGFHQAPP